VLVIVGVAPYGVQGMAWMAGMGQVNVVKFLLRSTAKTSCGGGYPIGLAMAILRQAGLKGGDE
jgi:hypothetical protein